MLLYFRLVLLLFLAFDFVAIDRISVVDHEIAAWFHGHLTRPFIDLMLAWSDVGSPLWIAGITSIVVLILILRKRCYSLPSISLPLPLGILVPPPLPLILTLTT